MDGDLTKESPLLDDSLSICAAALNAADEVLARRRQHFIGIERCR